MNLLINKTNIAQNMRSGLIVFLVALPLCLGVALASGAPLMSGLIAGIIGGIIVGAISNSNLSVSGPAAGLAVIVYQGIMEAGSFQNFTLAVVLAGIFQVALGSIKAGKITDYLPLAVIEGMMAAIGILLILKQVPYIFGESSYQDVYEAVTLQEKHVVHKGAILLGGLSIILFAGYRYFRLEKLKIFRLLPFPLFLVLGISLIGLSLKTTSLSLLDSDYVHIQEFVKNYNLLQNFSFETLALLFAPKTIKIAFVISIVASIESLLSIEAADKLDPKKLITNKNRELLAQGAGNILSGFLGGLPITSVVVRTSANAQAGATNKSSTIYHGFYIFLAIIFLASYIDLIPLAALATILIFTGFNLAHPKLIKSMYLHGHAQFIPFMMTIISIISLDLLKGVMVGVLSSILFTLKDHYRVQNRQISLKSNDQSTLEIKFGSHLTFVLKKDIKIQLAAIPANSILVLNFDNTIHIDHEIKEIIQNFISEASLKNIQISLVDDKNLLMSIRHEK
jgi:MFS superfamily sulfate permease-like transporter